jgi:hypothetical protein
MDESLEDKFLTYRTIARDYQLRNSQKVELIHNLFDEEALRFYNNHVREKAATIEEVYQLMSKEFNSITRQEKVKNQLHSLKLHHFVELKGMTANEALDHIQAKINAMLPQCPKEFNHDSYKRELLRAAVVGNPGPPSQSVVAPVSGLRSRKCCKLYTRLYINTKKKFELGELLAECMLTTATTPTRTTHYLLLLLARYSTPDKADMATLAPLALAHPLQGQCQQWLSEPPR